MTPPIKANGQDGISSESLLNYSAYSVRAGT